MNTPWQGTGNRHDWDFTGADNRDLLDRLGQLDAYRTSQVSDRWVAAIVHSHVDGGSATPDRGWTIEGALRLADLLPQSLADLATDLRESFGRRAAGYLGDAHTPPRSSLEA